MMDAVISLLIISSLGLAALILLSTSFQQVSHLDMELRNCLKDLNSAITGSP